MERSLNLHEWLTLGQASRLVGCSPQWLSRLAATGRIEATTTPLGRVYRRTDCEQIVAERTKRVRDGEVSV